MVRKRIAIIGQRQILAGAGDHKARMDLLLYGSEHDAALRAAKRLGANQLALAKARIAAYKKAPNTRALLEAVPHELHNDPGYIFSKIQLLRREEKFADAAQLMVSAPKEPARLHNLDEGWIALRFLNDPATAAQHFARIGAGSVNPTTLARAGYWQGRAAEAAGRGEA